MPNITFHPGKLPPDPSKPKLMLPFAALDAAVPTPKPSIDYYTLVTNWQMYLNDQLGDCTIAQAAHGIKSWTKYAQGTEQSISDAQVLVAYEAVSGYNPKTGANDNGAVLQDVLDYWRKTGIGNHNIKAFAALDVNDITELHQAVQLFGSVTIGFSFPAFAMEQFNAGQPWDLSTTNTKLEGGHAVNVVGYDTASKTLQVVTWGAVQEMTEAFWKKYVDEAWVVITSEWLSAAGLTPEGMDLYGLGEDFAAITGESNPFPGPAPAPKPTPTPDPVPTPTPAPIADADLQLAAELHKWLKRNPFFYQKLQIAAGKWLTLKNL